MDTYNLPGLKAEAQRTSEMRLVGHNSAFYSPTPRQLSSSERKERLAYQKRLTIVYTYLESHYAPATTNVGLTRKIGSRGAKEESQMQPIIYYHLEELCQLLRDCQTTRPKMLKELSDSCSGLGKEKYLGRETFVRKLHECGCLEKVADYCLAQMGVK